MDAGMSKLKITGGNPLFGKVEISGAKKCSSSYITSYYYG